MLIWKKPEETEPCPDIMDNPLFCAAAEQFFNYTDSIRATAVVPDRYSFYLRCASLLSTSASENHCSCSHEISEFKTSGIVQIKGTFYRPEPELMKFILRPNVHLDIYILVDGTFMMEVEFKDICTPIDWEECV